AGGSPRLLTFGDLNGDGIPDLAIANYGSNSVSVLLGNGNGTFQNQIMFAASVGTRGIAASDFDGDGRLDLAASNLLNNTVSVLQNAANGNFAGQVFSVSNPAVPTHFVVNGLPANTTAGMFLTFTVLAEDQFNLISNAYHGTVTFSSSDH